MSGVTQPRRIGLQLSLRPLLVSFLALTVSKASALSQQYCSNQNTGSDYSAISNSYQSNGACSTTCSGYAFAVVQGLKCWCSNYTPGSQSSTGDCSVQCPGYPYENCGNENSGLFGYVALGPSPSGTQGSAASSSADQPSSSDSFTADADQATPPTITATFIPATSSAIPASSSSPTTTSSPSSTSTSSSTWSPTPVTQVETVTGQVKTLTITPTTPPAAIQTVIKDQEASGSSFSQSPGKIAGVSIAVILVCAAIIGALVWFCLRKRRRQDAETLPVSSTAGGDTPQRRPSRLSQLGLISSPPASGGEKDRSPPMIVTSGWGGGNTQSAEKSPADTLDRRGSYPRIVDQRLEPTALWNPLHDNGSHVSVRSFRDDQDYSRRMLRVSKPSHCLEEPLQRPGFIF